ncbi:MAG: dipicolinate synthase subunit B [Clostridia bacterium]|nr:dipicolinate synthase subunit B [Clostridia bacterium]
MLKVGYALCGSFCTISRALSAAEELAGYCELVPIVSANVKNTDTRFGTAASVCERLSSLCGREIICTVEAAEPLGPAEPLDALVIAPCTGNTLAKLANGITDSAVTMAAKAHLRQGRPLLIALASNDALSANLKNVAALLNRKSVYFVPMAQDDPAKKPSSLVAEFGLVTEALNAALEGKQIYPVFRTV